MSSETPDFRASEQETTGRFLVLFHREAMQEGVDELSRQAGVSLVSAAAAEVSAVEEAPADGLVFERLGVAVVDVPPDQGRALTAAADEAPTIAVVEPERVVYATASSSSFTDGDLTWGLQAVNVEASDATGRGIGVAVLDTGFDLKHPDFAGRNVVTESFVPHEKVQDGHGHGTHCIGTSCGPRDPQQLPGYGVAPEAEIFAGKVLNNQGRGSDQNILAGIEWALRNSCRVVSMSLGGRVQPGDPPSQVFESVGRRALDQGTLIVAAAGNDSDRDSGFIAPVSHPANCESIVAVAALNSSLEVASFSNGASGTAGGEINIAGPGVDVHSSWPMPRRYRTISGTSMATPHVAGVAALFAQLNPDASARDLLDLVTRAARSLPLDASDVGAGLVQAPPR
jgi:subtilisin family serine protease